VTPAEVLAQELRGARRRGERFEKVFPAALEAAVEAESVTSERRYWRAVFTDHEGVWHGAYDGQQPSRPERALSELRPGAETLAKA